MSDSWNLKPTALSKSVGLILAGSLALTGCGGSSSSNVEQAAQVSVSGIVSDPAIMGAKVRLDDANGNALAAIVTTDSEGRFSFPDIDSDKLANAILTASGGTDTETGVDFTGLTLQAAYQADEASAVVSPLTTFIVEEMQDNGTDYQASRAAVAARFGLAPDLVDDDPETNTEVQKVSLQLSRIAAALRANEGFEKVFELTEDSTGDTDWDQLNNDIQAGDYPAAVKERIAELVPELEAIDNLDDDASPAQAIDAVNRLTMLSGVKMFMADKLGYTPEADSAEAAKLDAFAAALWQANNKKGISSDSAQIANVVRYALNKYDIELADFADTDWSLPGSLQNDSLIKQISDIKVIDHRIALADEELLDSNDSKRAYFYASDLAPAYRAERLYDGVIDDSYVDAMFVWIAADYALRGMQDRADVILKSQIFNPLQKARGYAETGESLQKLGKAESAQTYRTEAETIMAAHMQAKGFKNLDADDASFYQNLAADYSAIGKDDKAATLLQPVREFISDSAGEIYSSAYGKIGTAIAKTAKALIDEAEASNLSAETLVPALAAVEFYEEVLSGVGIQKSTRGCGDSYKIKAFWLTDLAEYYMRLNQPAKVAAAIKSFNDLRAGHACTRQNSEFYVAWLVEEYAYLDDIAGFTNLVETTITSDRTKTRALDAAVAYQAIAKAKGDQQSAGDIAGAIADITAKYPDNDDADDLKERIELLTNKGVNLKPGSAQLAVKLFQDGFKAEGSAALNSAWDIANSETFLNGQLDKGINFMYFACAKIAYLTHVYVDESQGHARMTSCATLADTYAEKASTRAAWESYAYLAALSFKVGLNDQGRAIFDKATAQAKLLSGSEQVETLGKAVYFSLEQNAIVAGLAHSDVMAALATAKAVFDEATAQASDDDSYKAAAGMGARLVGYYAETFKQLRLNEVVGGFDNSLVSTQVAELQGLAASVALSAQDSIANITSTRSRERLYYPSFMTDMTDAQIYDTGAQVLENMKGKESEAFINKLRSSLGYGILGHNAFPGAANLNWDLDNDGTADFYEVTASDDEAQNLPVELDDDIDGDGTADGLDATPFCANCDA